MVSLRRESAGSLRRERETTTEVDGNLKLGLNSVGFVGLMKKAV